MFILFLILSSLIHLPRRAAAYTGLQECSALIFRNGVCAQSSRTSRGSVALDPAQTDPNHEASLAGSREKSLPLLANHSAFIAK
jgi:putative methionine-R-sulfoxide reductase with GAF domain